MASAETLKIWPDGAQVGAHDVDGRGQVVDVAVAVDHEAVVGHEHRPALEEAQEHRRLHVEDVVVGPVDRGRAHHGTGEAGGGMAVEQKVLHHHLEAAVGGGRVGADGAVLEPRKDATRLVGHDRGHEDVASDVAVEQLDQPFHVGLAGHLDEAGYIDYRVPRCSLQRRLHARPVGAVGDELLHPVGQGRRRDAAVEHGDRVALAVQAVEDSPADERATAEDERLHRPRP